MAWLKFDVTTPEKPEVLAITIAMGWDDPDLTVGKLLKVWRWFDQHTIDGNAKSVTSALLDRLIGVTGLTQAIADSGWLVIKVDGLTLPNFETHNGKTAKDRALTASRVAKSKSNGKGNGASVTPALPREEKRREEVIPEAKASADKSAEELTKAELWSAGKSILESQGMPAKQCGSFVGKLVKDYGESVVIDAVRASVVNRPADAAEYLKAICMRSAGQRQQLESFKERDARIGRERWEQMTGERHPDSEPSQAPSSILNVIDITPIKRIGVTA